jgi:hypothetical protein
MKVLLTFRESSPSSKLLQEQGPIIWWTNTCPWHGENTTLQLHRSTMLGACLFSFTVLFIAGAKPSPVGKVMTLLPRGPRTYRHVHN